MPEKRERLVITVGLPLGESVKVAYRALASNKMRAGLTMLGMIIGIFAVIATISMGQSAAASITQQLNNLGTNMLIVNTIQPRNRQGMAWPETLTLADARVLGTRYPGSISAVAGLATGSGKLKIGNEEMDVSVTGTTPNYTDVDNAPLREGRFISAEDVAGRTKVAVIGETVIQQLLGNKSISPVGRTITINTIPFNIIGVMAPKGSLLGNDQDKVVIIPISTAMRRLFNQTTLQAISVECVSADTMDLATEDIHDLLRQRHHLHPPFPDSDDFQVQNLSSFVSAFSNITTALSLLLGGVGTISLLVGGIGIMNIMLVSVTERTREIGLRKAMGATRRDIQVQFLIEAMMLSLAGGLLGMLLGIGLVVVIISIIGWPLVISPWVVVVAVLISALIGVTFGSYPAAKAARLSPIDALRYE
ncbi:MAG: ABC transporter permease [Capsulimonadaceae bacterium]